MTTAIEPLLLDTHLWIWLNEGVPELSEDVIHRIDRAAAHGQAFVSVMSVWEVSLLQAKQRVVLGLALPDWVERALAPPIRLATLTPVVARECHYLPGQLHNDPVDRILVATARSEGLTLVTRDRAILDYAARGHLRALAC
jgi:PIN domain nuclease of toxin-antitoxin system